MVVVYTGLVKVLNHIMFKSCRNYWRCQKNHLIIFT